MAELADVPHILPLLSQNVNMLHDHLERQLCIDAPPTRRGDSNSNRRLIAPHHTILERVTEVALLRRTWKAALFTSTLILPNCCTVFSTMLLQCASLVMSPGKKF